MISSWADARPARVLRDVTVQRLRSSADVRAVFAARTAAACPHAVVHLRRRGDGGPARFTVVAGKNVGNAVARNRVKRRLRGVIQGLELPPDADFVVVGRPAALAAPAAAIATQVKRTFQKLEGTTAR